MTSWGSTFGGAPIDALRHGYDEVLVPVVFQPWARLLLDRLAPQPGEALLDVACGPGSVAHQAAERVAPGGRVTGCDLSPSMLALAREKPDAAVPIDLHEAPADRLPVADGTFDVATCQQGLQFFPDRAAALAEMRRALRDGGRVAIAVWAEIETCTPFAAIAAAIEAVVGDDLAARYRAGPWGMPLAADLRGALEDAGLRDVQVERHTLPAALGADALVRSLPASGVAAELAALPPDAQERLSIAIAQQLDARADPVMTSHIALARR